MGISLPGFNVLGPCVVKNFQPLDDVGFFLGMIFQFRLRFGKISEKHRSLE